MIIRFCYLPHKCRTGVIIWFGYVYVTQVAVASSVTPGSNGEEALPTTRAWSCAARRPVAATRPSRSSSPHRSAADRRPRRVAPATSVVRCLAARPRWPVTRRRPRAPPPVPAAPRRPSAGGAGSSTATPQTTRLPGSRSSARSPTRNGSGRSRVSRRSLGQRPGARRPSAAPMCRSGPSGGVARTATAARRRRRCRAKAAGVVSTLPRSRAPGARRPGRAPPGPRPRHVDGPPERLARRAPARCVADGEDVAEPHGAGGQRPGDHGAGAPDVERAVDPEPDVGRRVGRGQAGEHRDEPRAELVEPCAGRAADRHDGGAGERRRGQLGAARATIGAGSARSERVTDDHAVRDAEGVERGQVLRGLRHPGVVGGDHEHDGGDRSDPGEHRGDEPLVARHVDERHVADRRELGPAVAELDRQPAARSSASRSGCVPVSAWTSVDLPWSTWPAVATTCTSAPRCRSAPSGRAAYRLDERVVVGRATASRSSSSRPSLHAPDDGGVAGRSGAASALGQRDRGARRARPRARRRRRRRRRTPTTEPPRRRRAPRRRRRPGRAAPRRRRERRRTGGGGPVEGRLERRQGQLVDPQRPRQGVRGAAARRGRPRPAAARTAVRRAACRPRR